MRKGQREKEQCVVWQGNRRIDGVQANLSAKDILENEPNEGRRIGRSPVGWRGISHTHASGEDPKRQLVYGATSIQ